MVDLDSQANLRVLIVDDNRDAADTLATLLKLEGFEASAAYSGWSALEAARANVPDCIIADLAMPGMNGFELAHQIRADPRFKRVRLIAHSSFGDDDLAREADRAGFHFRLTKASDPLDLLELVKMMEQLKAIATKTKELAKQNVELVSETRDTLKEVKQDVKEVKQEVKELKQDVKELKEEVKELKESPPPSEPS
jgi:two-component system, OmpR family, response regulator